MRTFGFLLSLVFLHSPLIAQKSPSVLGNKTPSPPKRGPVVVHKVQYTGTLSEEKASFLAKLSLECTNKVETVLPLLTGDIAVTDSKLPEGLRLERSGKGYLLSVNKPGEYEVELNILAKITKADPWRKVEFTGPAATIGGVNAEVAGNGMELELLSGTPQPRANGEKSKISGALGADRKVSLRWQTKVTRQERSSLLTVQTISTVQVTPTIIKYSSVYNYDILQGKPTNVVLRLPASQALTSVKSSAPVRDRRIETLNGQQVLTIDFVKPLEKKYNLTLLTEQPRAVDQATTGLEPPEPKGVQRERGQVNLQTQDMKVEPGNLTGLRRVNAAADTIGAWQFFGREPFQLEVGMQRIEPVLNANDIVQVVLEEKMLRIIHALTLNVEKAGIYIVELTPQDGLMVADVVGAGISDWVEKDGKITLEFSARVMGQQQVTVVLEEMSDELPAQVKITPLLVTGALRQTAQIAVTPARGLELKKDDNGTNGLRETPTSIGLAFSAADPDWNLAINPRKLPPRLIAQVSNGVVIGENRVYGFAKIFYAISDQGVQQFHVRVPVEWENIQFLGTRKRRELKFADNNASKMRDYTLTLQDEVWDQYTLQITYDLPLGEDLSLGGAHPMQEGEGGLEKLERDTGTIVIHSAANIKLEEPKTDLSRIDPSELDKHERGRITHPILYAYKYDGEPFDLKVAVGRYQEQTLLNSVADYAELTTVVTGNGQVATTALLSVKKTDKDNPSFKLPEGSEFISCRINGTTVTPGLENDNYIIPLPEEASRNQVFEVQISYSEKHDKFKHDEVLAKMQTGRLKLSGPVTLNIPNTYSRWTVYVPNTHELYGFEGNMVAPRKKQYTLATAWERFVNFLRRVNWAGPILTSLIMTGFLVILIVYLGKGLRRALITTGVITGIMILGGVVIALSMGGMTSVKYAATDSEYRHPAESVTPGWHEKGEAEGERSYRSSISSRESRFRDMDEAGAEELQPKDPASKTESPSKKSPKPDANKESQPGNSTTEPTPTKPGQDDLSKGTPGGAGGIGGGSFGPVTGGNTSGSSRRTRVSGKEEDSGRVTGVLPPEFVIPTDGRAYVFTKALNLAGKDENERLKIDANIMDWNSHRTRTGIFHWLVVLAGLLILVREYRQKERDSRWITAGLALIFGGVGAFMCSQGALHLLFINALWVLALAIYAWAAWYFWPAQRYSPPSPSSDNKGDGNSSDEPDQPVKGSDGTSAATATAILLLFFSLNTALAADPVLPPPRDAKAWEGLENLLRLLADPDVLLQKPGGPKVIREAQLQDRNGTWFEINQENPFTGKVLGFFQNRQKRIESDYQDGLLHGVQTLWFDNGQKRQLTQHEKGLQHGVQTAWYRGGQKASESNYQKGKRQGSHSIWHPNGTLAGETSYLQGEPNGLARQWHNNGKIAREVRWERGRQLAFDTWTAKGVRFGEGTNTVSMVSASYQLNVHSEVAQVEAEFKLSARLTKQKFTLFREIIAVNEFSSVPAGAKLLREGPALVLYLPEAGEATVKMKFLTKHAGDATKRMLGFGIPSSLTSKVDVVLQEDDSEVEMPTAVTFSSSSGGNETLVEAVIGASDRLELTWKPRVKKAKEIAATVFVQNASTISFGNGVVQARTVLDYTVSQGELSEVKAVLPEGWKLMKVEGGKTMRTYFVKTEGDQSVLTAQLEKGVSTSYQLILEMEQTLAAPPTTVKLSMPRALGVKRETGFIALQSGEELGLTISESNGLLQVDGAEFTRNTKQKIQAGATSYGYNNPNYTLATEVETILPEIEATARHLTAISEEKLLITTQVNYSIKHVGIFKFRLRLPAEAALRVKNVTGPSNPQWEEKTVDGSRLLLVTLKQHTKGTYPLRIELVQTVDALPEELRVVGVHPLNVDKLTNLVGIYAEEGVVVEELAEGKSDNLTEMSAARFGSVTAASNNSPQQMVAAPSIPANANALAYRHLDEAPGEEPGWNVTVSTKALEPWVRNAQLVNWIKLGNTRLTGHTRVRYEIERAPARQFTLILPATINTNLVKFEGANIRSRESRPTELGHLYTITLQDKVRPGQVYQLNIDWELSQWNVDKNGTLGFQGPVTQGTNLPESEQRRFTAAGMNPMVEGEEGWLVVSDESHTQLMISTGATLQGLEKKNTGDLPEWAKDGSESARLVYYYFRPGYQLDLNVKRLEDAAVEPAWISQANFNSVVTEDGQMMTRMWLEVNNHGKQFLGITLPGEKAEILSVFVNGQARRPTMQDKRFLVPLENSGELGAFPVEVTYTSRVDFPRMSGRVELPTPSFDVKLNNAHWWLYLPRDYAYSRFEGSMNRTDSQAISRRVSKLDTNKDGRLDQEEMGKDMQLGEILNNEDELTLDLAKANQNNPRSGAYYGYDFKSYKLQEMGNTKRVIDNIAKQQAIVESNFNKNNLSAINRYNDQSIKSINQLSGVLRGKSSEKYNQKLNALQDNQRKLESKRRDLQVEQEQYAQQRFAFRNAFNPQQWGGQNAGTTIVSSGQMSVSGRLDLLIADKETVERQKRQIDEIDRIQKRVTTGEVTPLNINLPRDGFFVAFSQPLQTEKYKSMTISFETENTRRTNWWGVLVWSTLAIAILFFMVQTIRHFALRKPPLAEV